MSQKKPSRNNYTKKRKFECTMNAIAKPLGKNYLYTG